MPAPQAEALKTGNRPLTQEDWAQFSPGLGAGPWGVSLVSPGEPLKVGFSDALALWVLGMEPHWLSKLDGFWGFISRG